MKRRTFLKSAAALPVVAYFPPSLMAQSNESKTLILVQFGGGNDSLNTFVPYTDAAYYAARGSLAVTADEVLPLTAQLGLNPVMSALQTAWQSADMAVVQGLGYPSPNRSHFRSIEIWQTASDADVFLSEGWLSQVMPESQNALQGVVLSGSPGALQGENNQFSLSGEPGSLDKVYAPDGPATSSAVEHVLNQRNQYNQAVELIQQAFSQPVELTTEFADDSFSQQCELTAQLLVNGIRPSIVHLSLGSFDTHSNQRNQHDGLLQQLADGLSNLRQELINQGLWQQVTIASYSEFGRRVAKNASEGTDHGTAASHLVMGGAVKGGLYSLQPSLSELEDGDMEFTKDFRAYYRTLADWAGWPLTEQISDFENLGFLT